MSSLLWTHTLLYTDTQSLSRSDILQGTVTTFCGVNRLTVHTPVAPIGLVTTVSCSTMPVPDTCGSAKPFILQQHFSSCCHSDVTHHTHTPVHTDIKHLLLQFYRLQFLLSGIVLSINKSLHICTPLNDTNNNLCPSYRWFPN